MLINRIILLIRLKISLVFMSTIKCDVLVVGAGPGGSSAARASVKKGLKTIIIEEDEEVGIPVQCAEGIGSYLFHYLPFEIPKNQLIWKIDGIFFRTDNILIKKILAYRDIAGDK